MGYGDEKHLGTNISISVNRQTSNLSDAPALCIKISKKLINKLESSSKLAELILNFPIKKQPLAKKSSRNSFEKLLFHLSRGTSSIHEYKELHFPVSRSCISSSLK
jgi:hypothetical protein